MAGSNSIRSDAMPSSNANPAALVNFIFRQLPDDVLDEMVRIVEVRIIKRPERREYRTKV
jgi:hypothetical protein